MPVQNEYIFQNLYITPIVENTNNNREEEVSNDDLSKEEDKLIARDMRESEELEDINVKSSDKDKEADLFEEDKAKK